MLAMFFFFQGKIADNNALYQERQYLEETLAISMDSCKTAFLSLGEECICDAKGAYLNMTNSLEKFHGDGKYSEVIKDNIVCFIVFENDKVSYVDDKKTLNQLYEMKINDDRYRCFFDLKGNVSIKKVNGYFGFSENISEITFNVYSDCDKEIRELAYFYINDLKNNIMLSDKLFKDGIISSYRKLVSSVYGEEIFNKYEKEFAYFENIIMQSGFNDEHRPFIMALFDGRIDILNKPSGEEMVCVSVMKM